MHLGPGPAVDDIHAASLRAALLTGGRLEITEPGESEDVGLPWDDPAALTTYGTREPTEPWTWAGPARSVTGRTWGGCIDVLPVDSDGRPVPGRPAACSTAACCCWRPRRT